MEMLYKVAERVALKYGTPYVVVALFVANKGQCQCVINVREKEVANVTALLEQTALREAEEMACNT